MVSAICRQNGRWRHETHSPDALTALSVVPYRKVIPVSRPTLSANPPDIVAHADVQRLIEMAILEDVGAGDVTTDSLVPADRMAKAIILTR